ncbi:hypothetical protein [Psychrobacter sp. APC 3350]|uniref:hypothetical protein n=1 Tax=unclassified Psychrobacter TaxID=196806 RepID=UPI0025B45B00|nr:hypothetical protein [Psychrobacter sp. APC 3350]MDN3454159.1 hypothetical protein [Psychrobacter sp. APC 3350]MDN3503070.1 hypothetical protein [Psychrobacter sp. 5A.1]
MAEGWVREINPYHENGFFGEIQNKNRVALDNYCKEYDASYIPFVGIVYNLEVANNHTYFVDHSGILVHNTIVNV